MPPMMDKRWELKLEIKAYKITLCRILLHLSGCTTSLRPTRWVFILSANLIRFQVGAEIQVVGEDKRDEGSEEDETEVLECPRRTQSSF